jgi:hypothetical protein
MDELIGELPPQAPIDRDLSAEIERAVEREPLDRVRCIRVFDDFYRCNWWAPTGKFNVREPLAPWAEMSMHRIRKSRFLNAAHTAGKLVIRQANADQPVDGPIDR